MPILSCEPDVYPDDLLCQEMDSDVKWTWWAIYTRSRQEKELMRRLRALGVAFYCPLLPSSHRSVSGCLRTSYLPMFGNYVFVRGDGGDRYRVLQTNLVSQTLDVPNGVELVHDLRQIQQLLQLGSPLRVINRLTVGARVRIKHGPLCGMVGSVLQQHGESHFLISVNFLQQGAVIQMQDCDVEPVD